MGAWVDDALAKSQSEIYGANPNLIFDPVLEEHSSVEIDAVTAKQDAAAKALNAVDSVLEIDRKEPA